MDENENERAWMKVDKIIANLQRQQSAWDQKRGRRRHHAITKASCDAKSSSVPDKQQIKILQHRVAELETILENPALVKEEYPEYRTCSWESPPRGTFRWPDEPAIGYNSGLMPACLDNRELGFKCPKVLNHPGPCRVDYEEQRDEAEEYLLDDDLYNSHDDLPTLPTLEKKKTKVTKNQAIALSARTCCICQKVLADIGGVHNHQKATSCGKTMAALTNAAVVAHTAQSAVKIQPLLKQSEFEAMFMGPTPKVAEQAYESVGDRWADIDYRREIALSSFRWSAFQTALRCGAIVALVQWLVGI